ncbi:hypothetical protein RCL1_005794 [Eukaryota sp. TZLM3-RCL]
MTTCPLCKNLLVVDIATTDSDCGCVFHRCCFQSETVSSCPICSLSASKLIRLNLSIESCPHQTSSPRPLSTSLESKLASAQKEHAVHALSLQTQIDALQSKVDAFETRFALESSAPPSTSTTILQRSSCSTITTFDMYCATRSFSCCVNGEWYVWGGDFSVVVTVTKPLKVNVPDLKRVFPVGCRFYFLLNSNKLLFLNHLDPHSVVMDSLTFFPLDDVTAVVGGDKVHFFLTSDGSVYYCSMSGYDSDQQCRLFSDPIKVEQLSSIAQIDTTFYSALFALDKDGKLWRYFAGGSFHLSFQQVLGVVNIIEIAGGYEHVLCRDTNNRVFTVFNNNYCPDCFGHSPCTHSIFQPKLLANLHSIRKVAAAGQYACLGSNKDLYMWGDNQCQQVTPEDKEEIKTPILVERNVDDVFCATYTTFIVRDGKLFGRGMIPGDGSEASSNWVEVQFE